MAFGLTLGLWPDNRPVVYYAQLVLCFSATGDVRISADGSERLGAVLLAGAPIGEPIMQHGPFVMSNSAQIRQAFRDYQQGGFLRQECTYKLHTKDGTTVNKRRIDPRYRR